MDGRAALTLRVTLVFSQFKNFFVYLLDRIADMLKDVLEKLASGILRPHVTKKLSLENAVDYLSNMQRHEIGKAIVVLP